MDTADGRLLPVALTAIVILVTSCAGSGEASPAPASGSALPSPTSAASEPALRMTTQPAEEAPAGAIVLAAGPGSKFTPNEIETSAGDSLTFFIDMTAADVNYFHNLNIGPELPPAAALATTAAIFEPGESVVVTVNGLAPGTYYYWCSINEHYKYGMHGKLTVI